MIVSNVIKLIVVVVIVIILATNQKYFTSINKIYNTINKIPEGFMLVATILAFFGVGLLNPFTSTDLNLNDILAKNGFEYQEKDTKQSSQMIGGQSNYQLGYIEQTNEHNTPRINGQYNFKHGYIEQTKKRTTQNRNAQAKFDSGKKHKSHKLTGRSNYESGYLEQTEKHHSHKLNGQSSNYELGYIEPNKKHLGKKHKRNVTESTKKLVAANQQWKCAVCGCMLDETYEVDHVNPLYKGGSNDLSNLMALDPKCHRKKTNADRLGLPIENYFTKNNTKFCGKTLYYDRMKKKST